MTWEERWHPLREEWVILAAHRQDRPWSAALANVLPLRHAVASAPTDGGDYSGFHFHIEFHPPLRKPDLLKFVAGPEVGGGNFLSDTSPEEKADELRAQANVHYKERLR